MIDWIRIGRFTEVLFIGAHWCNMTGFERLSIQEGFRQQFIYENGDLYQK